MDSIMPYWKNSRYSGWRGLLHSTLAVLLLCASFSVQAEGITFKLVSIGEDNGEILLDL